MKKTKSKIFLLCSVIVLSMSLFSVFMLTGCDEKRTKISVMSHKAEIDKSLQELCRKFEQENPDIKIELQSVGGGNDYESNLLSKLNSKSVNMFCYEGLGNMMNLKDKLVDLSDMEIVKKCKRDILDSAIADDDRVYGFPVGLEGYGYTANKKAFAVAGVDVSQIKSFSQLEEGCEKLKAAIESGKLKEEFPNAKTVWRFPGKATWSHANHPLHVLLDGDFKTSMEAYNSKEVPFKRAEDYKKLIDFQTRFSVEGEPTKDKIAGLNSVDYSASFDGSFLTGQSFICQQGTWVMPQVAKYDQDNKTNLAQQLALLPFMLPSDEEGKSKYVVLSGQCWAISNFSSQKQIEACKKFLTWLNTSKVAKDSMIKEMKLIPLEVSENDIKDMDVINQTIAKAYLSGDYISGGSKGLVRTEAWSLQCVGAGVQEYIAGKISFDEVIKRAKLGWTEKYEAQMKSRGNVK